MIKRKSISYTFLFWKYRLANHKFFLDSGYLYRSQFAGSLYISLAKQNEINRITQTSERTIITYERLFYIVLLDFFVFICNYENKEYDKIIDFYNNYYKLRLNEFDTGG